jgi:hypothetical protein
MAFEDFNETQVKLHLATLYDVYPELISLEASAGSVEVAVTFSTGDMAADDLLTIVGAIDDSALISTFGVNLTSTSAQMANVSLTVSEECPPGHW